DAAAGVAGLIKTVKMLQQHMLPPSLHVVTPNPRLGLEQSAFYINTTLSPWETNGTPRRAGVSSFGIGGTNAHIVLEEAPTPAMTAVSASPSHLLVLSARTEAALQQARTNLLHYLQQSPDVQLADVAYTLQAGRKAFHHRSMLVCHDMPDAIEILDTANPARLLSTADEVNSRSVVFMFPGQGTQYVNMGREIYSTEAVFRAEIDRCAELLLPSLGLDLKSVLYPDEASDRLHLNQTWLTQPALFVVEYALARLWLSWGITPTAMIGHSIGEYVAACLAGVFSLEEALKLVVLRGRLMQQLPSGAMLAVSLPLAEILPLLNKRLSLAALNTPEQCVVSGTHEDIEEFTQLISEQGAFYSRLHTSHAFHSLMVEPIVKTFEAEVAQLALHPPRLPYISNVSGTWISQNQATDPGYWGQHLRETVRFADGISTLLQETDWAFLEVGPGRTLGTFVKAQQAGGSGRTRELLIAASLPPGKGAQTSDRECILTALGHLWLGKVPVQRWNLSDGRRIPLPTYPFERKRYWIERSSTSVLHPVSQQNGNGRHVLQQEALEDVVQPLTQQQQNSAEVPPPATLTSSQHDRPHLLVAYRSPRNELEQGVVAVWQQLFGINGIGIDDPFFDLGGDSLLAVQLLSQLRAVLHINLTLQELFEAGTVAGVVQRAEVILQARASAQEKAATPPPSIADAPLSFTQRRLWFLDQLEQGNSVLNISLAFRIQGPLNRALMARCFQEIIHRHAALRTYFVEADGEPVQRIMPSLRLPLPLIDLQELPSHKRENALASQIAAEAGRPFDLSQVPLIRTTLLYLGQPDSQQQEEHVLLLSMHHAISDGWSMGLFLKEFSALYAAFSQGQPSPLSALPMQYVDFAAWQRAQETGMEEQLEYWRGKLGGELPVLDLPTDYPRPVIPTYRGARQRLLLPGQLLRDLKQLGQREGITLFMVLLGAFQALLSRYSGQEDILVSTPIANRNHHNIESLIGPFIDLLVLRTDLSGDPTFHELLGRVREVCLQAYAHQNVPFDTLVEAINPQRDTSRAPLTQVVLRLPNAPMAPIALADLTLSMLPMNVETADQDLTLDMIELPGGVEAALEYNTALFAPATIERLLRHWQVLLEAVVASPLTRLAQLPLLTPLEARTILSE
ncbi:MAG TPA: condensation domain-containing protein, partial [Ktedonobacteraceae bacterium]|nr:condensation domain-containing protein [Ktedonobacteraceae bacterium]